MSQPRMIHFKRLFVKNNDFFTSLCVFKQLVRRVNHKRSSFYQDLLKQPIQYKGCKAIKFL